MPFFTLEKEDDTTKARLGTIETAHGTIETPVFMPVGTRATVKTVTNRQLEDIGASIILGNTYHLMLRPGADIIAKAGGLHKFMRWEHPILTDSGGFQVFSLAALNTITDEGVTFQSHIDGSRHFLGPNESMKIQKALGSDIVMAFDECPPYPSSREKTEAAVTKTLSWARKCRDYSLSDHQHLFGIVQGSTYDDIRRNCAEELRSMDFDGYAIGGLSVGEPREAMNSTVEATTPHLPADKPRYLMGVGTPRNIVEAVMRGVDMFDCVMPTRNARNGTAFTTSGKIHIKNGKYSDDFSPLDPGLDSYASQFSKAYVRHLINVGEVLGLTLVTLQNLAFYLDFMKRLRHAIRNNKVQEFYAEVCKIYPT
ncbi:MAG: tRNA guanosine(34) transglycosylase Tgt [Waddliaceae bacterium]|mgnify:CR=1 FL=1|nr:tRNA guanosine(34) transglycosylase Tgt [Waddliaceae bacterium]